MHAIWVPQGLHCAGLDSLCPGRADGLQDGRGQSTRAVHGRSHSAVSTNSRSSSHRLRIQDWTDIKDPSEPGIRGHVGYVGTPNAWALSNSKWPWQSKCPHWRCMGTQDAPAHIHGRSLSWALRNPKAHRVSTNPKCPCCFCSCAVRTYEQTQHGHLGSWALRR